MLTHFVSHVKRRNMRFVSLPNQVWEWTHFNKKWNAIEIACRVLMIMNVTSCSEWSQYVSIEHHDSNFLLFPLMADIWIDKCDGLSNGSIVDDSIYWSFIDTHTHPPISSVRFLFTTVNIWFSLFDYSSLNERVIRAKRHSTDDFTTVHAVVVYMHCTSHSRWTFFIVSAACARFYLLILALCLCFFLSCVCRLSIKSNTEAFAHISFSSLWMWFGMNDTQYRLNSFACLPFRVNKCSVK